MQDEATTLFLACLNPVETAFTNLSLQQNVTYNTTREPHQDLLPQTYAENIRIIVQRMTPIICLFGVMGNILNLIIFTYRFHEGNMNCIEKGAITSLTSLAVSDLLFCLITSAGSLVPNHRVLFERKDFGYYYQVYGYVLKNTLMKVSTWLTTVACVSRYAVVCYPLWARQFIRLSHIRTAVIFSFILPFVAYIPLLWTHHIHAIHCGNVILYILDAGYFEQNRLLNQIYNSLLAVSGYIVPTAIMMYCNASLIISFNQTNHLRRQMRNAAMVSHNQDRITVTLIAVVVFYTLLISPSEIYHLYQSIYASDDNKNNTLAVVFTNVLLSFNFSLNFVLYSAINVYIRKSIWICVHLLCGFCTRYGSGQNHESVDLDLSLRTSQSRIGDRMEANTLV